MRASVPDACKGIIDPLEPEREFAPHESALCDWCSYWDPCPVKKHLVKHEALKKELREAGMGNYFGL
jgi:hypothetical protein